MTVDKTRPLSTVDETAFTGCCPALQGLYFAIIRGAISNLHLSDVAFPKEEAGLVLQFVLLVSGQDLPFVWNPKFGDPLPSIGYIFDGVVVAGSRLVSELLHSVVCCCILLYRFANHSSFPCLDFVGAVETSRGRS